MTILPHTDHGLTVEFEVEWSDFDPEGVDDPPRRPDWYASLWSARVGVVYFDAAQAAVLWQAMGLPMADGAPLITFDDH